jgi:hypothetical protein
VLSRVFLRVFYLFLFFFWIIRRCVRAPAVTDARGLRRSLGRGYAACAAWGGFRSSAVYPGEGCGVRSGQSHDCFFFLMFGVGMKTVGNGR